MKIGGNISALVQVSQTTQNEISEDLNIWVDTFEIIGYLDLASGNSSNSTYNAKIEQSTHVFICDYFNLKDVTPENSRVVIDDKIYEVNLYDNPMSKNAHLEIYLKYIGGQYVS